MMAPALVPISGLPAAGALGGTEETPIVQGGTTKRTTLADIVALVVLPAAATVTPLVAAGAGAVGVSLKYARQDHVHPAQAIGTVIAGGRVAGSTGVISQQKNVTSLIRTSAGLWALTLTANTATNFYMLLSVNDDLSGAVGYTLSWTQNTATSFSLRCLRGAVLTDVDFAFALISGD